MTIHTVAYALGLIHYKFILEGRTVNKEMYVEIIHHLTDAGRRKHPKKWAQNSWFLLHNNTTAYQSSVVKKYIGKHNVTALEYLSHSLDLSPLDFFLFLQQSVLKGQQFASTEEITAKVIQWVSKNVFQECLKYVTAQRKYSESNFA
jgi:hypothetical protein